VVRKANGKIFAWGRGNVLAGRNRFLSVLVNRGVFFLFLMCLLVFFLYAIGTAQGFMDSTQLLLLKLESVLDVSLAAGALGHAVMDLIRFLRKAPVSLRGRDKRIGNLLGALGFFVLGIAGILAALATLFVITVSGGNAS
jgi:hypothetical protein